jgi:hypothetical protein
MQKQAIENRWPDKLEYSISTPSKAVLFGTTLGVEFRLVPLLKGLTVGKIVAQFIENCEVAVNHCETDANPIVHKSTRLISTSTFSTDACQQLESSDEEFDGYRFVNTFDLPKTLNKCVQDADVKDIKIRHKLKFRIQLHNPDRHVSEVCAISNNG